MVKSCVLEISVDKFRQLVKENVITMTIEEYGDGEIISFPTYNKAIGSQPERSYTLEKGEGKVFNRFYGTPDEAGRYLEGVFKLDDIQHIIK